MNRFQQMFRTTAVRLTVLYTLAFSLLAVGVVTYISYNTGRLLISQIQATVDEEVADIARATRRGGVRRLIPMIDRRSRGPSANLYLIADSRGFIVAGNVREVDLEILSEDGWRVPPFEYTGFNDGAGTRTAIARVFTLPSGLKLLVGRDVGDAVQFRTIVRQASTIAILAMVVTAAVLWFFIGRRALRHIDSVSQSSARIIAGDLSQRLPLSGSGDEFDRLSTSLNNLLARVEKLNTGVSTMSDSIAHDLKTPLTRLRNRAEAALGNRKSSRVQVLNDIIADADGLIRTFDALLMISQVSSGARTANLSTLELAPIISDVHELFEPSAEELGIRLRIDQLEDLRVQGNRELLAQALTNLLDNALKYGAAASKPEVLISLQRVDGAAQISVCDNGTGIAAEDFERVTDRFVRLDQSRTQSGSGLGLSLVKAVVDLHGGRLLLEDAQPGLCAKIVLPFAP